MTMEAVEPMRQFLFRHGIHEPVVREPAGAGRNSRVTRIRAANGEWILKQYGASAGDRRLDAEYSFLQYLESLGIDSVPRPVGCDRRLASALYSSLPGVRPTQATSDQIAQAAVFVARINMVRESARARELAAAADACRTWEDHLSLGRTRLTQLAALEPASAVERQALKLVEGRLLPAWRSVERRLAERLGSLPELEAEQVLSPSDFGFHNTLLHLNRLAFVDFEYAGWDDPAKLVCDFFCQPEVPVTSSQGWRFLDELVQSLPGLGDLRQRVELLLPAHRLKWCGILLNEFRPHYHRRRVHAGIAPEGLLTVQLEKAQAYFEQHFPVHTHRRTSVPAAT